MRFSSMRLVMLAVAGRVLQFTPLSSKLQVYHKGWLLRSPV